MGLKRRRLGRLRLRLDYLLGLDLLGDWAGIESILTEPTNSPQGFRELGLAKELSGLGGAA